MLIQQKKCNIVSGVAGGERNIRRGTGQDGDI